MRGTRASWRRRLTMWRSPSGDRLQGERRRRPRGEIPRRGHDLRNPKDLTRPGWPEAALERISRQSTSTPKAGEGESGGGPAGADWIRSTSSFHSSFFILRRSSSLHLPSLGRLLRSMWAHTSARRDETAGRGRGRGRSRSDACSSPPGMVRTGSLQASRATVCPCGS